ncbi:MAG TPA: hypothetical protein VKM72_28630 [Thermoanaerobaculia bacterium]|nr:hypothetical protein [Thermoanaerobaculia bacterium]
MRAFTFSSFGGPEVLEYRDVPDSAHTFLESCQSIGKVLLLS